MTGPLKQQVRRLFASTDGSVAILVGALLVTALGAGVMVVDYTRAATLQAKLQHAMDTSVGEAARGKSDAEVIALAKAQLSDFLKDGNYETVDKVTFTVSRANGRVTLSGTLPYSPLFGPLYGLVGPAGNLLVASVSSERENLCTALPAEKRWTATTGACAAGELGSKTWEREEERTSSCAAGASAPTWSSWSNTGATRAEVNTCAQACSPEPAETQWINASATCPAGQLGDISWQAEQRRVSTCAAATGSPTWSSWSNTGTKRNETNTCATVCTPSNQTQWTAKSGACPAMYSGTMTWEEQESRSSTCASQFATPVWSPWVSSGLKQNEAGTCTPIVGEEYYEGVKNRDSVRTYTFTVPEGVTQISIMAIGGGSSGYSLHGENATEYQGAPGGKSSVTGPDFTLTANGGAGTAGGCGGSKQGGACGGNGATAVGYSCSYSPRTIMPGAGGGAAAGPKGRGGDGSATGTANLGQNGAGAGGTVDFAAADAGQRECMKTCLAGDSTGLGPAYGKTAPGEKPGGYGHTNISYTEPVVAGKRQKLYRMDGVGCGDAADKADYFGGGGGGAPGIVAVKQSTGKYLLTITPGKGGGGGELSYGTYTVTPGAKLTVVPGHAGSVESPVALKLVPSTAWATNTEGASLTGSSWSGDGDPGAVWIIWGPGRSFPDNVDVQ